MSLSSKEELLTKLAIWRRVSHVTLSPEEFERLGTLVINFQHALELARYELERGLNNPFCSMLTEAQVVIQNVLEKGVCYPDE